MMERRKTMMDIYEKLAKCSTAGEVERMLRGNGMVLAHETGDVPHPPVPMFLTCPGCGERHIDKGSFATKPHHTHACQGCGLTWRPAIVPTVGVQFLPGFKDAD
jgi:hypothetical protein